MGDGVLAYFGDPVASEDAAERAIRASSADRGGGGSRCVDRFFERRASVGVASGPVVVRDVLGDNIAREVNVIGETPNLAARLLGLVKPNGVVMANTTRRLVGDLFTLSRRSTLSRFRVFQNRCAPSKCWANAGDQPLRGDAQDAPGAPASSAAAEVVGLMLDRWEQAKAGDGQLVLLLGEAGRWQVTIAEAMGPAGA